MLELQVHPATVLVPEVRWMQVLSLALKPRALWVAAHHLDLSGRMDGLWSALLNALADLVSGNEAEVDARRQGHKALLTKGLLLM